MKDYLIQYDEYEQAIIDYCTNLKVKMLNKYQRGREEHGGPPTHIDVQHEINLEVLDILNYHLIDKVNDGK